ncbi:hypothetical protein PVAG01_05491 [Phlyctema vagabunda]|uniref:Uncharacterized protein n=1 Tax=Phlyctema vagabunda TaxID=108571 RepID=A0ABR4PK95_9HELO
MKAPGKWKSDGPARANTSASIRGNISAPIPKADDDEFPIRSPGTSIAMPVDSVDRHQGIRGSTVSGRPTSALSRDISATVPSTRSSHESPPAARRAIQPSGLRNSEISMPTTIEDQPPQRKKSSLRSALGRLFGKKRKSIGVEENELSPKESRKDQHRSDPYMLNRPLKDTNFSQKRSTSLPINEYNRALRSHSVGPDSLLIQENPRESQDIEYSEAQTRPRRATTPSRSYTPSKAPGYVDWTGLSPRPVSSYARGSKAISEDDAEAIGYAVTKGSHPNRRSRSLGHLRNAIGQDTLPRRRSDEIKYWRESYIPGALSPMSSNKPETEEPILPDQPEMPTYIEPQEPPQPFNFGPMGEMAGMKITQAASLETRVSRLETRLVEIEKVVSQIQHRTHLGHVQLQDPPKRDSRQDGTAIGTRRRGESEVTLSKHSSQLSQNQAIYDKQTQSSLYGSSRPSTTSTNGSYRPSYNEGSSPPSFLSSTHNISKQDSSRPLSTTTTVRAYPSSPPKGNFLTTEHFANLTNMILAEQAARENLESIVNTLKGQLASSIQASRKTSSYATLGSLEKRNENGQVNANLFAFEADDSSDDEGRFGTENFSTPREERPSFNPDEESFAGMGGSKSPPRTLSLSQITMKTLSEQHQNRIQPGMNF